MCLALPEDLIQKKDHISCLIREAFETYRVIGSPDAGNLKIKTTCIIHNIEGTN